MPSQGVGDPIAAFSRGYRLGISPDASGLLSSWLRETFAQACSRWPQIELGCDAFSQNLGQRLAREGVEPLRATGLHAVELFLTFACTLKLNHAADAFDRDYLKRISPTLRHIDASEVFAEEVRQGLRDKLLVGEVDEEPRISSYSGRGPLLHWVSVAAQREGLSLKRASNRRQQATDQHAAALLSEVRDPELAYMKERYRNEFQEAFRAAIVALSDRDRIVLRFNVVECLSLTKIGAMYGVNQSTVTRWIASAREQVVQCMLQFFQERLGLCRAEFESIARMVQSEVELNVSQLLLEITPE